MSQRLSVRVTSLLVSVGLLLATSAVRAATLDIAAGVLTYTAVPGVTNRWAMTTSALNLVVTDTGETITLTPAAIAAGWIGSGTGSVTGPRSSVTGVVVDLRDQADSLAVGSVTLTGDAFLTSGGTIDRISGGSLTAARIALIASTGIATSAVPFSTRAQNLEAQTATGGLFISNGGTVTIGGVSPLVSGLQVTGSGDLRLYNIGTININLPGETVAGPGAVNVLTSGSSTDLNTGGQTSEAAIRGLGPGDVQVYAARNINLGDDAGIGSVTSQRGLYVTSDSGSITMNANAILSAANAVHVECAGRTAVGNVVMSTSPGSLANAPLIRGAYTTVTVQNGGTLTADSTGPAAIIMDDSAEIMTDNIVINKSISSTGPRGAIYIEPASATRPIDLGTKTPLALSLTPAELSRLAALYVSVGNYGIPAPPPVFMQPYTGSITVSAAVTVAADFGLITGGAFIGTPAGSIKATSVAFVDASTTGRTWSMSASEVTQIPNPAVKVQTSEIRMMGGEGADTFTVVPSSAATFHVFGGKPAPAGTTGDALNVETATVTDPRVSVTSSSSGFAGSATFSNAKTVYFNEIELGNVAPARFIVTIPATANATTSFTGSITPVDVAGVPTLYGPTVQFTSSDPYAVLPISATMTAAGTFQARLVSPGAQTITATEVGRPAMTGVSNGASVTGLADLVTTKTAAISALFGSLPVTYTLSVSNAGPSPAPVTVSDVLPTGMQFVSSAPAGACSGTSTITCSSTAVAPGASTSFTVVATAPAVGGTISNTATATSPVADPLASNNTASASLVLQPASEVPTVSSVVLILLICTLAGIALVRIKTR